MFLIDKKINLHILLTLFKKKKYDLFKSSKVVKYLAKNGSYLLLRNLHTFKIFLKKIGGIPW